MSTNRNTLEQQIENAREEIRQRENKVKKLLQQQKDEDRKARTKRLIERGAILESLIDDAVILNNEQIKMLLQAVLSTAVARDKLTKFSTNNTAEIEKKATHEADAP